MLEPAIRIRYGDAAIDITRLPLGRVHRPTAWLRIAARPPSQEYERECHQNDGHDANALGARSGMAELKVL